jgi:hypothetical protein
MGLAGHIARMGIMRNAYRMLIVKSEGKRALGRPRHRWEDIIKLDLREREWDAVDWINCTEGREQWRAVMNMIMNLWVL